jgi:hypothetical protein
MIVFQFQIEDAIKAARTEATEAYNQYVEEPKTSQRRGRFDLELELVALSCPSASVVKGTINVRENR